MQLKNKKPIIKNKQLNNELSILCLAYYFGKQAINSDKKITITEKLINVELFRIVKLYNRVYNDILNKSFKILDIIEKQEKVAKKEPNKYTKYLSFTLDGALEIDALLMCIALIFEFNERNNKHFCISNTIVTELVQQYEGDYNKWFNNPRLLASKFGAYLSKSKG